MSEFTDDLRERGLYDAVHAICVDLGLRVDELHDKNRAPVYVEARARVAKMLREKGWSFPMIAKLLGYGDHTSVMAIVGASRKWAGTRKRRGEKFDGGKGAA